MTWLLGASHCYSEETSPHFRTSHLSSCASPPCPQRCLQPWYTRLWMRRFCKAMPVSSMPRLSARWLFACYGSLTCSDPHHIYPLTFLGAHLSPFSCQPLSIPLPRAPPSVAVAVIAFGTFQPSRRTHGSSHARPPAEPLGSHRRSVLPCLRFPEKRCLGILLNRRRSASPARARCLSIDRCRCGEQSTKCNSNILTSDSGAADAPQRVLGSE